MLSEVEMAAVFEEHSESVARSVLVFRCDLMSARGLALGIHQNHSSQDSL